MDKQILALLGPRTAEDDVKPAKKKGKDKPKPEVSPQGTSIMLYSGARRYATRGPWCQGPP